MTEAECLDFSVATGNIAASERMMWVESGFPHAQTQSTSVRRI